MKRTSLPSLVLVIVSSFVGAPTRGESAPAGRDERLWRLLEDYWQWVLDSYPEYASRLGHRAYDGRWTDLSLAAIRERQARERAFLARLEAIDRQGLTPADRINHDLFRHELGKSIEGHRFRSFLMPMSQLGGIQTSNQLADSLPFESARNCEDWIARLRAFGSRMDQTIALMREGMKAGIVPPQLVMERALPQIEDQIVEQPEDSLFYAPFAELHEKIDEPIRAGLKASALAAIRDHVLPAFRKLHVFVRDEYLPACTEEVGVWQLPQGEARYAYAAGYHTTTNLTPEEIYEIGLAEVERIGREMAEIRAGVGFEGSREEFFDYLRTDDRFRYDSADRLLEASRSTIENIDRRLPRLFLRAPKIGYVVRPIPDHVAPYVPTAYYEPPAEDGSRPGTIFVNTYQPETRPAYQMIALMLHEGIPGHHFQLAMALELEDVPRFRKHAHHTAYIEGWALYCEWLGYELDLYGNAYDRFGQLSYDMWRACRLVVDTGIHHYKWPRQKAIDYIVEHTGKSVAEVTNEVDRYIVWPGQALSYKIGQLRIMKLRDRAESELGQRFDVRVFHEMLLSAGSLPLDVLETRVDEWIERQKGQ